MALEVDERAVAKLRMRSDRRLGLTVVHVSGIDTSDTRRANLAWRSSRFLAKCFPVFPVRAPKLRAFSWLVQQSLGSRTNFRAPKTPRLYDGRTCLLRTRIIARIMNSNSRLYIICRESPAARKAARDSIVPPYGTMFGGHC